MRHAEWKEPRRLCMLYVFFFGHWLASVFFQSLFQHRYAAHRMYTMKPRTGRSGLCPSHGAIVNWRGPRHGYRSFETGAGSRSTLPLDDATLGELLQNNQHRDPVSANFAGRWFEMDPAWQVMKLLAWAGVI